MCIYMYIYIYTYIYIHIYIYIYIYMSSICLPNITCQVTESGPVVASFRYTLWRPGIASMERCWRQPIPDEIHGIVTIQWKYHEDVPCNHVTMYIMCTKNQCNVMSCDLMEWNVMKCNVICCMYLFLCYVYVCKIIVALNGCNSSHHPIINQFITHSHSSIIM